jgi:hypothetical protein
MNTNGRLFDSQSSESPSNNPKDDDIISVTSLNIELTNGLHYLASTLNTFLNSRPTTNKNEINLPIIRRDSQGNGWYFNLLVHLT